MNTSAKAIQTDIIGLIILLLPAVSSEGFIYIMVNYKW